jgi:hypothetical protein
MASLLNIGPVYIDPSRKGSLAKQGMVRRRIDVAVRPATTIAGKAVLHPQSDLTTFAASLAGVGRIGEQLCNAGIRGLVCHERPGSRPTPKRRKLDQQFLAVVPVRIFAASAAAIRGRDGEKQVIRLMVACNCAKRDLPRLKSWVSSEEFL